MPQRIIRWAENPAGLAPSVVRNLQTALVVSGVRLFFSFDCELPSADALAYFSDYLEKSGSAGMTLKEKICVTATQRRFITAFLVLLAISSGLLASSSLAQGGNQYKARLAPAPPLGLRGERGTDRPTPASYVAGIGSATATLSGRKLTVNGTFEKMASPPTVAKVGVGLTTGARLDLVYDLTVTKSPQSTPPGTSGTISGSIDLTPSHVDALKAGKLYVQINSESAPNGHLLGWLLK
jgi:hypothetical protein